MESSEVNGKRRRLVAGKLEEESGIKTACYPKDFKLICDALSRSKRDAVVEMGFGPLLEIGCIKLIRDLCEMFVDNFEVQQGRCTIKIHGILLSVNVADFERLMGVRNCGTQVELERCSGPDDMKELKRKLCGGNGDISIDSMKQRIVARQEADDIFKINFVLFTLVVLLCPSTPNTVDMKFLIALSDASSIGSKNWASLCFKHLVDGVVAYKDKQSGYMSGCLVFLQLFYFDSVGYSSSIVCKSVLPVIAWTLKKCKKMIDWVIREGGFHSTYVGVSNKAAAELCGSEERPSVSNSVKTTVSDDVSRAMNELDCLQNEVDRLNLVMDIVEVNMAKVSNTFIEIDTISRDMTEDGLRRRLLFVVRNVFGSGLKSPLLNNNVEVNLNNGIGIETETLGGRPLSPIFDDGENETEWCEASAEEDVAVDGGDNAFGLERDDELVGNDNNDFLLKAKTSPEDLKLLKFVFDEPHISADKSAEVVARFGEIVLTKGDIECMRPRKKIKSKVINLYAAYLCEAEPTTWFFPTNFSERCPGSGKQCGRDESLGSIIKDCRLHKFNRRLKRCSKIFIPVHDETLERWWLVLIKVRDGVVEIWDSNPEIASLSRRQEMASSLMLLVQKVFASDMKKPGDIYYDFPSFEVTVPKGSRWDANGYESGIYVMRHMAFYGEPWYDGFESVKERTEIALEIVKNSKNEELNSIRKSAGLSVAGNKKARNDTSINVCDAKNEGVKTVDKGHVPTGRKMRSHRKRKDPA
ncbi:hypothetical protein ACLB2K_033179 [Fragaria x ananassa]